MKEIYLTKNPEETKRIAASLASRVLKSGFGSKAFLIGLTGDLGGGKTTFVQGFARGLGLKKKILSPTFLIMKRFTIKDPRFTNLYHLDCYRIKKAKEVLDIGIKEIMKNPQNIVVIEWADKIKKALPLKTLWIDFDFVDEKTRKIIIKS